MPRNVIQEFEIEGERFDVTQTLEANNTIWLNRWDEEAQRWRAMRNVIMEQTATGATEDSIRNALTQFNAALANYFDTEEETIPETFHDQIRWFFENRVIIVGRFFVLAT